MKKPYWYVGLAAHLVGFSPFNSHWAISKTVLPFVGQCFEHVSFLRLWYRVNHISILPQSLLCWNTLFSRGCCMASHHFRLLVFGGCKEILWDFAKIQWGVLSALNCVYWLYIYIVAHWGMDVKQMHYRTFLIWKSFVFHPLTGKWFIHFVSSYFVFNDIVG